MHSPHDIQVLLHEAFSCEPWPKGVTLAYKDSLFKWFYNGILLQKNIPHHANGVLTEKGTKFVARIMENPIDLSIEQETKKL